ncbi:uncharacterized protein PSFLO_04682 [Pseudozyma flocculosa]|uniref:Dicer-like protein 1 n=1 Tax=Pseudozyma flocculosa TaxID=84751 RepID=A0A5C3F3W8_9BASI|nr:uncharacterized protein PSFLO_04682 [Pseudozyma flocculosa]
MPTSPASCPSLIDPRPRSNSLAKVGSLSPGSIPPRSPKEDRAQHALDGPNDVHEQHQGTPDMLKRPWQAARQALDALPIDAQEDDQDALRQQRLKRLKKLAARVVARTAVPPPATKHHKSIDDVEVRSYQSKLFEQAKTRNLIVCLPTGSGKTLVSVLLLQHMRRLEPVSTRGTDPSPGMADQQGDDLRSGHRLHLSAANIPHSSAGKTASRQGRVSFFLVNLVPLVHQQANVIASFSDLRVGKVYGELKDEILDSKLRLDTWRKPEWDALLDAHDVVVATAQCLLGALVHAYVRIDDIDLLVFDEAHHAIKSHPYARIMLYYRLAAEGQRPKILGMTASPVFSLGDYGEASKLLEQTLDAEIVTAPDKSQVDLQNVVNRPVELVAEYDAVDPAGIEPTALSRLMHERCADVSDDFAKTVWPKIEYSLIQHGQLMTDLVWHGSTQEYFTRAQRWQENARKHSARRTLLDDAWTSTAAPQDIFGQKISSSQLSADAELNRAMMAVLGEQPPPPSTFDVGPHNCSPKVLRLIEILKCFGCSPSSRAAFCGIIFVQRRQTAAALAELLRRVPELDYLKPEWLIGHDTAAGLAMDWHDQVEVLDRFRRRAPTNLLIATSVAEEGLDIQAANVVVRFDLFDRHSGFLQSRGRARSQDSRFVVMAERNNLAHYRVIASATLTEMGRRDWLAKLAEKTGATARPEVEEDELGYEYFLAEPLTGARLYPQDAPNIVSHYAGYLRVEQGKDSFARPEFEIRIDDTVWPRTFVCHLKLPANSQLREVVTEPWTTKRAAKRMAALEACRRLRELDLLDEHLMPRMPYRLRWDPAASDSNGAIYAAPAPLRSPTRLLHFRVRDEFQGWNTLPGLGQALGSDGSLRAFATLVPLERLSRDGDDDDEDEDEDDGGKIRHRSLFLVTAQPLPPTALLQLYGDRGLSSLGEVGPAQPVVLSAERFDAAQRFTETLLGWITHRQQIHDLQAPFLVLPAEAETSGTGSTPLVDWSAVEAVASGALRNAGDVPLDDIFDAMIIDRADLVAPGSFYAVGVRRDLTPFSRPPPGSKESEWDSTSYFDHYCKSKARYSGADVARPPADQPLLSVRKLDKWRNQLVPRPTSTKPGTAAAAAMVGIPSAVASKRQRRTLPRMLIPFYAHVHPLPLSVARSGLLLPSVFYRYDDLLLSQGCSRALLSDRLPGDLVLTALTPPARNAGFDYERLEFYGDTVLKLLAACQVFTTRLSETEGELHVASKEILVNQVLEVHAMRLKLWKWVRFSDKWMKKKTFWFDGWTEGARAAATAAATAATRAQAEGGPADAAAGSNDDDGQDNEGDDDDVAKEGRGEVEERQHLASTANAGAGGPADNAADDADSDDPDTPDDADLTLAQRLVDVDAAVPVAARDVVPCKALSDMVEALLGASLVHSGIAGVLQTAVSIGILPDDIAGPSSFHGQLTALSPPPDPSWRSRVDTSALSHLERVFDYTFAAPHLALEAFTHPSLLASVLPSYQRLEYLGDAFLDYCVILKIRRLYPHLDEGEATALKSNMVSNATLSALCEVLDLTSFIASHSAPLKEAVSTYTDAVRQLRRAEEDRAELGRGGGGNGGGEPRQYWWTTRNPKAVADVVESSLGAVLVDARFDFDRAERVFEHVYWPFLRRWCTPELAVVPNIKVLTSLLTGKRKCSGWGLAIQFAYSVGPGQEGLRYLSDAGRGNGGGSGGDSGGNSGGNSGDDGDSDGSDRAARMAEMGAEAVRCRIYSHGVLLAETTERIRSHVQRQALIQAKRTMAYPQRSAVAASIAARDSLDAENGGYGGHDDKGDASDAEEQESERCVVGQVSLPTFRAVIKAMRWMRPFDASTSFPEIAARTPPKMVDVVRCSCKKGRRQH